MPAERLLPLNRARGAIDVLMGKTREPCTASRSQPGSSRRGLGRSWRGSAIGFGPSATVASGQRACPVRGVQPRRDGHCGACLSISRYVLDLHSPLADNAANIVGIGLGALFRFWAYREFMFAGRALLEPANKR